MVRLSQSSAVANNLNGIGLDALRPSIEAAGERPAATTEDRPIAGWPLS